MASIPSGEKRGQWGSSIGFILAASGSAVGLGNIWRFPYLTGENGGGAFVFVYLICVLLIGLPLLFNEIGLGRNTSKNPVGAIKSEKPGSAFIITGFICITVCFFVLSYYGVIAGWTIGYMIGAITDTQIVFSDFAATAEYVIPLLGVFIAMTVVIILGGVSGGIEKAAKILMPMLLVILVLLVIRSLTLEGAMEGVKYYLIPDFTKITFNTVLLALGQAFFSMSVGWGLMVTYGSYLDRSQNMVTAGIWIAIADTVVALLGGLLIFPAVFAFGHNPAAGPALVFEVLPQIFQAMPGGGQILGALFFLLLMVAALTSSISMLEVPVSYLIDEKKWNRKKAAWVVGGLAFIVGIPSALSAGALPALSEGGMFGDLSFLDFMDKIFGTMGVVVISLLFSVFVGWVINPRKIADELAEGGPSYFKAPIMGVTPADIWVGFIKYVCPVVILIMLIFQVTG